jgi:hypothetical protein
MNLEKLFEYIYSSCNEDDYDIYLESPLDTENKPPMLLEDIYFECNVKPLKETVTIESGRIYIFQTEEEKDQNINEIWNYYSEYAKTQATNNRKWRNIRVENTDPPLIIDIYPKKIKEVFSHTAKDEKFRSKIICIQALPILIKNMSNIILENETKGA